MSEVRLIDANALKETLFIKFGNQLPNGLLDEIDNAPTVKTYCYFCGQTEHGKIEEKPQGDLISRSELKKEFAKFDRLYIADTGNELVNAFAVDKLIRNAPTVCGNNPKWCESCVSKGKCASTKRPQGEWIEDGYRNLPCVCSYCGEVGNKTNYCPNCGADMHKPNCVTCDHFGKCDGCEKGEEE